MHRHRAPLLAVQRRGGECGGDVEDGGAWDQEQIGVLDAAFLCGSGELCVDMLVGFAMLSEKGF